MTRTRSTALATLGWLLLLCTQVPGCSYDFTTLCGNNVRDDGEDCDGASEATTCTALGYEGGANVACNSSCAWDISDCVTGPCGNGAINPGEACDGFDLGGANCVTQGMTAGTLTCNEFCDFDTSSCTSDCGPPSAVSCPSSSISDDFDDNIRAAIWGASFANGDAAYSEDQGYLWLTLPLSDAGDAAYMTHDAYQLTTYGVRIELVVMPHIYDTAECFFEVKDRDSDDTAGISLTGFDLSFYSIVNQTRTDVVTVPFVGNLHHFWRLSTAGDTFYAEISGDGIDWSPLGNMPLPFQMEHVQIVIRAGAPQPTGDLFHAVFDNFNIQP